MTLSRSIRDTLSSTVPQTEEELSARVVRISPMPDGKAEVGIEFLRPAPKFWRIAFPPDDWIPHVPEITSDTF